MNNVVRPNWEWSNQHGVLKLELLIFQIVDKIDTRFRHYIFPVNQRYKKRLHVMTGNES